MKIDMVEEKDLSLILWIFTFRWDLIHHTRVAGSIAEEKLSVQEHLGMTHQQILVYRPLVGF